MQILLNLKHILLGATMVVVGAQFASAAPIQTAVDEANASLEHRIEAGGFGVIASIDHARLAAAAGVEMPPSRVLVFSAPSVNVAILDENVRAGLDLPFRVLTHADSDAARIVYTDAQFLAIRHGLQNSQSLNAFSDAINTVVAGTNAMSAPKDTLSRDYGIIELTSDLSVPEAVARLTKAVMAQNDTVWFGEIDFGAEAAEAGVTLPDAVLLLFGGPAPGGVAMAKFPAIGLDAFCQKLLVYAGQDGGSVVIFNDIAAFAELHYGQSADPHHLLNQRLSATFAKALR